MHKHIVIRVFSSILIPFIFTFGLYVLFHGKVSAGGGFQGGAICATAIILYAIIYGLEKTQDIFSDLTLKILASIGVLIYLTAGFVPLFVGGKFLDYSSVLQDKHLAEFIGIMTIEVGIQISVFAVMLIIFMNFANHVIKE